VSCSTCKNGMQATILGLQWSILFPCATGWQCFVVCFATLSASQITQYRMARWLVNNELEVIWTEAVLSQHSFGRTEEGSKETSPDSRNKDRVSKQTFTEQVWVLFYFVILLSGVRLSPLCTAATTGLLYQSQMIDVGDCGAIYGMKIGKGNLSTRRKRAPVPLCPPQIPQVLHCAPTHAAAVETQWLTAWAIARPSIDVTGGWLILWVRDREYYNIQTIE
jgi:hypothetical protein